VSYNTDPADGEEGEDDFFGTACNHCGLCCEDGEDINEHCPFSDLDRDERPCEFDEDVLLYDDENGEYKRRDTD
jgi:hypothetical protein